MNDVRACEPKLVISVKPGSEKRIRLDLLDALYPLDKDLQVDIIRGGLAVYSHLDPDTLCDTLKKFPIRGIVSVKKVIAWVELNETERVAEAIAAKAIAKGFKFSRVEIKSRGSTIARKIEACLKNVLRSKGLLNRNGVAVHVEFLGDLAALTVKVAN
ncbi:MAG: hypothetical protein QXY49_03130 [Thermofilaceae archaeon]